MTLRNVDDIYPLTAMQQLMLTHALAAPDSPVLSNQFRCRISGTLDVDALRCSWEDVVRRHPALRTAFIWEGLDQPLQAVRSNVTLPFELRDLRQSGARVTDEVALLRRDDQARRYTLTKAPLTRVTLVQIADEQHLLVWNVHHLVADRWSLGPLLEDLRQFYAHRIEGRTWDPPQASVFRAYVAWTLEQPRPAAEAYWRSALHGFRDPTLLGSGGSARPLGAARASVVHRPAAGVLSGLRARAASWSVSVGSPILAAIASALAEECRRRDVMFGLAVAGRPSDLPEVERTVGSFINNLPMRVNLTEGDESLHALTRRLQAAQARRQPFEYVSAADLRAWCEVRPSSVLFDLLAVINLERAPKAAWPGLELRAEIGQLDGAYPFVLGVGIDDDELMLSMTSADQAYANRFLARLSRALESIASAGAPTVGDLLPLTLLRDSLPTDAASTNVPVSPSALTTAESVLEIWRDLLGEVDLSFDDDLLARGATSLQILHACALMEGRLGRTPPLATIFAARSVRGLVEALGEPVERVGSLVPIRASGRRPPLFAVPGIGGNVLSLTALARLMTADQPFYGLQSKGLDGLEPPRADIRTIAREFVSEMEGHIRVPYALLGICWGAAVAFEMARMLTTAGRPPALLALLDPADVRGDSGLEPPGQHRRVEFVRARLRSFRQEIQGASVSASATRVLAKIRRAGLLLTDSAAAAATRSDFHRFSVERANLRAVLAYRPAGTYEGDGVLFLTRGRDRRCAEARLDWLQLIAPSPRVRYVSGSTVGEVLGPQNAPELAAGLREELDRAVQSLPLRLPDATAP